MALKMLKKLTSDWFWFTTPHMIVPLSAAFALSGEL